jgi:hypothetical protein
MWGGIRQTRSAYLANGGGAGVGVVLARPGGSGAGVGVVLARPGGSGVGVGVVLARPGGSGAGIGVVGHVGPECSGRLESRGAGRINGD